MKNIFNARFKNRLETPIGSLITIGDAVGILSLGFDDLWPEVPFGKTKPLEHLNEELSLYFKGKLFQFTTPLCPQGTPFQMGVWDALRQIPYGTTCSYATLAKAIGRPTAFRAAAQANGANPLPLIIPCHRVINSNGALGGYSSGLFRKEWLLNHEKQFS